MDESSAGSTVEAGLASDEAFLVAVKRLGDLDTLSQQFALEYSDRLWKQLVAPSDSGESRARARTDAGVAFCLAVVAAVAIKVPALLGMQWDQDAGFYIRNLSLFVLPLLTGYFAWKRRLDSITLRWLIVAFAAAGMFANGYPLAPGNSTEALTALHMPIALWLVVGIAYAGGRFQQPDRGPAIPDHEGVRFMDRFRILPGDLQRARLGVASGRDDDGEVAVPGLALDRQGPALAKVGNGLGEGGEPGVAGFSVPGLDARGEVGGDGDHWGILTRIRRTMRN